MAKRQDDAGASGFTSADVEIVAMAIDSAAGTQDQSHFDLASAAMAQLDDEIVPAMLRELVSSTFFRCLRLED